MVNKLLTNIGNKTMKGLKNITYLSLTAIICGIMIIASCKSDPLSPGIEYMPDMYRSPAYKPYEENPIFPDMLGARQPVSGTISQGSIPNSPWNINETIYPYPNTNEGYEMAGTNLKNPLTFTPQILEQGKDIYTKFCVHCHGESGDGNGSIVANGKFPSPGKYWDKVTLNGLNEGKMFHTLTYGKNMMGSHASQLTKEERWKVVFYVQDLIKKGMPGTVTAAADSTKKAESPKEKKANKKK